MNLLKNTTFIESLNRIDDINVNENEREIYIKNLFETNHLMKNIAASDRLLLNKQIYDDLEIFGTDNPIFSHINKTITPFGSEYLKLILKLPISNSDHLHNRQTIIKSLSNQQLSTQIKQKLNDATHFIDDLLWIWKPQTQETQSLMDIVYFKNRFFKFANDRSLLLNISSYLSLYIFPFIQLISPLIPVFTIFFMIKKFDPDIEWNMIWNILKQIYKINTGSKFHMVGLLVWFLVYLYGTYTVITSCILQYKIIQLLHNKLYNLTKLKNIATELFFQYKNIINNETNNYTDKSINLPLIQNSLNYLDTFLDVNNPGELFDNKGHSLTLFKKIYQNEEIKYHLIIISQFIGYMDSIIAISQLNNDGYSFINYIVNDHPVISFNGIWHPCLDPSKSVLNNSDIQSHRVITGPNAGGKSTYIKNVALLLLFSHTLTIGNCKKGYITPFKLLHSYIHLVDVKGVESLFEAEMNRCFEFIKTMSQLEKNQYCFAIFDELFTSTNFYEGVSAAYAICFEFIKYPNLVTLMTTHYSQLTELEKSTHKRFRNYKVTVDHSPDGKILFNYKIRKGISNQFIALDLLKLKGFDNQIINNAITYLNHMHKSH